MTATLTTNRLGSNTDYTKYLFGTTKKTDNVNKPNLLDFSLHDYDGNLVMPTRGSYIVFNTNTYGVWYTGFITNDGNPVFLGSKIDQYGDVVPKWAYSFEATSDEYILNLHPLGIIPPFVNQTQGQILRQLISLLAPENFPINTSGVDDGQVVPRYVVDPTQHFSDIVNDFTTTSVYRFSIKNLHAFFTAQDNLPASIIIDGNDTHFTPSRLQLNATKDPIVNDAIVIGKIEPQNQMVEYFVSDGTTGEFSLISAVFGVDSAVLLDDTFSNSSIDESKWTIYDPTGQAIVPANGFLNAIGGNPSDPPIIQSANLVPLEGTVRITHGEFDFVRFSEGLIGTLWVDTPGANFNKIFYGIQVETNGPSGGIVATTDPTASRIQIRPHLGPLGGDFTQGVPVDLTKRYILRSLYTFNDTLRRVGSYTSVVQTGRVINISLTNPDDVCYVQTIITEIDPNTAAVTGQWTWYNTIKGLYTQAIYTPFVCRDLHASVTGITVSTPMQVTLEEKAPAGVVPSFAGAGGTISASPSSLPSGVKTVTLSWTTIASTSVALRYSSPEGPPVDNGRLLPGNGSLVIAGNTVVPGSQFYLTDNTTQAMLATIVLTGTDGSPWVHKYIGPNELDAQDGMTPVATIVDGNSGATTKQSLLGTANYNPGQAKLAYFKNTAQYQSFIPAKGTMIKVSYNRAGASIGRVQDQVSIQREAAGWGDDGYRSDTRNNLQPSPRTSLECEIAAAALVQGSSYQHFSGSFNMPSGVWFSSEPVSATILKFQNLEQYPQFPQTLQAEGITQVATTFDHSKDVEWFTHSLTFGPIDPFTRMLSKLRRLDDVFTPQDTAQIPRSVELGSLGTSYIYDVAGITLDSWDADFYYLSIGPALLQNGSFEHGNLFGWSTNNHNLAYTVATTGHSGTHFAQATSSSTTNTNLFQQVNNLTPGDVVHFGVWLSSDFVGTNVAQISVNDSTGTRLTSLIISITIPGQWMFYQIPFSVGSAGNAIVTMTTLSTAGNLFWDDAVLTPDIHDILLAQGGYEIRYSDDGWGSYDSKNLITRTASRTFQIPRTSRGKVFFVKAYDARNRIKYSEDFTFWGTTNNPVIANRKSRGPNGELSIVSHVTASSSPYSVVGQTIPLIPKANEWYTFSIYVKGTPGETVVIDMYTNDSAVQVFSAPLTLAPGWNHFSISHLFTTNQSATLSCNIILNPGQVVELSQAQLENNPVFTYYAKTLTAAYGVTSRFSRGVHIGLPLAPPPPTASIDATDPQNPTITLTLPAALSDVWGIEIRGADNSTVLFHYDLTDPNYLQIPPAPSTYRPNYSKPYYTIKGNTQRSLTFYCYTYNLLGDYSTAFTTHFDIPVPSFAASPTINETTGTLSLLTMNTSKVHVTAQQPPDNDPNVNIVDAFDIPVVGSSAVSTTLFSLPDRLFLPSTYFRFYLQDTLGTGQNLLVGHTHFPTGVIQFGPGQVFLINPLTNPTASPTVPAGAESYTADIQSVAERNYVKNLTLRNT